MSRVTENSLARKESSKEKRGPVTMTIDNFLARQKRYRTELVHVLTFLNETVPYQHECKNARKIMTELQVGLERKIGKCEEDIEHLRSAPENNNHNYNHHHHHQQQQQFNYTNAPQGQHDQPLRESMPHPNITRPVAANNNNLVERDPRKRRAKEAKVFHGWGDIVARAIVDVDANRANENYANENNAEFKVINKRPIALRVVIDFLTPKEFVRLDCAMCNTGNYYNGENRSVNYRWSEYNIGWSSSRTPLPLQDYKLPSIDAAKWIIKRGIKFDKPVCFRPLLNYHVFADVCHLIHSEKESFLFPKMFKLLVERYFLTPNDEYEAKEKMKLLTYPDGNGLTPLMILSKYGDRRYACEYAEKLIHIYKDKDRNHKYVEIINAKGPNGWYPVHFAANNPRATEVLELLLRNGAWAEARTDGNEANLFESNLTPLHIACHIFPPEGEKPPNFEHAAYDNVKCILQVSCPPRPKGHNTSRDVPDRTNFVNTLYPTQRAENKKEYTKKKLIGWTPLHRLAKCPVVMREVSSDRRAASSPRSPRMERDRTKLEVCRLLIEFDATVNIGTDDGETVLHLAILQNDCDFCKVICDDACYKNDNAPNVDIPDRHGDAPVHLAVKYGAKYGNIDILKFLITPTHTRLAVDLKNGDNNGDTPLHLAINEMDLEMVELLVDAGAKVNFKNSEKKDAKKLTEDFIADLITDGDPDPNHLVTYRRISKVLTGGKKS